MYRIVIIGRPNVGKSTLFNKLIGKRKSIVHNKPGVTRDWIEEKATWYVRAKPYSIQLVDTGGMGEGQFSKEIKQQVQAALEKADAALFVFDSEVGILPEDQDLLRTLTHSGLTKKIPVVGVVNKVDAESHEMRISEFFSLGLDPILTVSAEHGRGLEDLKENLVDLLKMKEADIASETDRALPKVAIVGRPNVGKSTLINALSGAKRSITSNIPGTTTDPIDIEVTLNGKPFLLIDTAGVRRKSKTDAGIEVLSVVQTRKTLEKADIAILVLDGEVGISDQDEKIGGLIEESGCAVILFVNKWDTQSRNKKFTKDLAAERIRAKMAYLKYAPLVFGSALHDSGLDPLGDLIDEILHQRKLKISTHEFTEWVRQQSTIHNPRNAKFFMCHQSGNHPPTFVCHVNDPEKIHFSLKRNLVNAIRERWGYMGNPIRVLFVESKNRKSLPKPKPAPRVAGAPKASPSK